MKTEFSEEDFQWPECKHHCSTCCECDTWDRELMAKIANSLLPEIKKAWLGEFINEFTQAISNELREQECDQECQCCMNNKPIFEALEKMVKDIVNRD